MPQFSPPNAAPSVRPLRPVIINDLRFGTIAPVILLLSNKMAGDKGWSPDRPFSPSRFLWLLANALQAVEHLLVFVWQSFVFGQSQYTRSNVGQKSPVALRIQ